MTVERSPEAARLLALSADYMLEHGIGGVSLSRLAKDIGSNNRMLLYYFGSKDELFTAAILEAYRRFPGLHGLMTALQEVGGGLEERVGYGWRTIRAAENRPYIALVFESFALAVRDPESNSTQLAAVGSEWPRGLTRLFATHGYDPERAQLAAVQLLALWRGLQFLLLEGSGVSELDNAHDRAIAAMFGTGDRGRASAD
ncbi:TetR/AcrR family transcriptional regulator [Microbacterium sp. P07]|uniref:TetR/AcrR family transcriptional regulator n=1 Tax=Microbacterium sp. P07 TaxID=3366952 RepID=UPI00374759DB